MKTKHRNAAKFKRDRRNIDHTDTLDWVMRKTMPLTHDEILRELTSPPGLNAGISRSIR